MPITGLLLFVGMVVGGALLLEAPVAAPAWGLFLSSGLLTIIIGPGGGCLVVESEDDDDDNDDDDDDAGCGEAGSGDDRKSLWTRGIVPMNQLSDM